VSAFGKSVSQFLLQNFATTHAKLPTVATTLTWVVVWRERQQWQQQQQQQQKD